MAEGRGRAEWQQTSLLAAPLFNLVRDPEKRRSPFMPRDFDPYDDKRRAAAGAAGGDGGDGGDDIEVPVSVLKDLFIRPQQ